MNWIDPSPLNLPRLCIVCGKRTSERIAPLGIVSGHVPACHVHTNEQIFAAWTLAVSFERRQQQGEIDELPF